MQVGSIYFLTLKTYIDVANVFSNKIKIKPYGSSSNMTLST